MAKKIFDLLVVGSGPGGSRAAIQAAKLGKSVAIVERDRPGGASVHRGTIPSKSLREAALDQEKFPAAMQRMRAVVRAEGKVIRQQLERNGVSWFAGRASFVSPQQISVGGEILEARNFVLAPGTRPLDHAEFPSLPAVHSSDSILGLKKLPARLLVVGAGVIGCEYASIFARLGSRVTLADRRQELLRSVDPEVLTALQREFQAEGVQLKLGCQFGPLLARRGNVEVSLQRKKETFSAVLVCMGRVPNTEDLGLEKLGLKTDERGFLSVDRQSFRTALPHVYAVGDVIGPPALAASAAEQGRIAACRIFGQPCPDFPASFPYGIYTIPEISSVGMLEAELQEKKISYVVGRAHFRELARGLIVGDQHGFVKLLVGTRDRRLLGIHAIGRSASELVHIGQVVLSLGAPVDFLVDNVFNYPTFAEAYKVAALHAVNQIKA